ncbi:glycosyl transferase family 21-domain-containing protein [Hyaloraphidium curvatum]|nr:glycosyl transferase family 21-domain-containing protein [Hyaloraphidium curvatum]
MNTSGWQLLASGDAAPLVAQMGELRAAMDALPLPQRAFVGGIAVWYGVMTVISLIGTINMYRRYSRPPPPPRLDPGVPEDAALLPGVTILRPLKGVDANLRENLRSSLDQRYPDGKLQVIMSVADAADPALPIARELKEEFPDVAEVFVGELAAGKNPKVRNLAKPFRAARHPLVWTIDSNVLLADRDVLLRAVEAVVDGAELVHHLPVGVLPSGSCGVGAMLEAAFLGTAHAKMYTFFNWIGIASCVIGKSCLYRKDLLERFTGGTGIEDFKDNLAEDNSIAKLFWNNGKRHAMTPDLAYQHLSPTMRFRDYWTRRLRWIRVRKFTEPAATVLEPLTESVFLGLCAALALRTAGFPRPDLFLLAHFSLWALADLVIWRASHRRAPAGRPAWQLVLAWCARELLAFPLWCAGVVGSEIDWRGGRFSVRWGGTAVPLFAAEAGKAAEVPAAAAATNGTAIAGGARRRKQ